MNLETLAKKKPAERDVMILQALASGQYAFGQYQTALDLLHLALRIGPTNAESYVMIARIQYAVGDLESAHSNINKAVAHAPNGLTERDQIFERRIRLLDELAEQQRLFG